MFTCKIDETTELGLLELHHAQQFYNLVSANHSHISDWMFWLNEDYSIEDAKHHIQKALKKYSENDGLEVGIWLRGELAGCVKFNYIDWKHKSTELGYWLGAAFQGQGLITKACGKLIDYAFDELGLNRVEMRCIDKNKKSRAIPERLGFKQEGVIRQARCLKDRYVDLIVYGLLASEWKLNNGHKTQPSRHR